MPFNPTYSDQVLTRAELDALPGPVLVEFGSAGCGWCRAAQPVIEHAMLAHAGIPHIKVADGPGRALGRSFRIKLWPTLVFLRDGREIERLVRPDDAAPIASALQRIA